MPATWTEKGSALVVAALALLISTGTLARTPPPPPGSRCEERDPDPEAVWGNFQYFFSEMVTGRLRPGRGAWESWSLEYRGSRPHAAFAVAEDPAGLATAPFMTDNQASPGAARAAVLALCAAAQGIRHETCRIVATDRVAERRPRCVPDHPLNTAAYGPFRVAPLMFDRGPPVRGSFRDAVIWIGQPERAGLPGRLPGTMAQLNNSSWDVLRHEGAALDLPQHLGLLLDHGWRHLALAGHGEGALDALAAAAARPGAVRGVLAFAPPPGARLDALLAAVAETQVRLAFVVTDGDPSLPDPAGAVERFAAPQARRSAPTLMLWPDQAVLGPGEYVAPPPIRGGDAPWHWRFTRGWGGLLVQFLHQAEDRVPRGIHRTGPGR